MGRTANLGSPSRDIKLSIRNYRNYNQRNAGATEPSVKRRNEPEGTCTYRG